MVMRPISMSQTDHDVGSGSQFHRPAQSLCFPRGETSSSYCYPFLSSIFSLSLLMPNPFLSSNFCFLSHFLPQSYYLTFQPCFPFKDSQDGQVAGPASLHLTLVPPPLRCVGTSQWSPSPREMPESRCIPDSSLGPGCSGDRTEPAAWSSHPPGGSRL